MIRFVALLSTLTLFALAPLPTTAQAPSLQDVVSLRLLEGWRRADGQHMSALEIRLAPGWKTYWRSPGEGGVPLVLDLDTGPVTIHWPRPEVFRDSGMRSIGYSGSVLLPLQMPLGAGAQTVSGQVAFGVCEDICVPVQLSVSTLLPDGGSPDPRIIAALSDRPLSADEAGAGEAICQLRPIADGLRIELRLPLPDTGGREEVVFELPDPSIWISDPATRREGSVLIASADLVPAHAGPFALDRSELRTTVLGRRDAVEIQGCRGG